MPVLQKVRAPMLWVLAEDDVTAPSAHTRERLQALAAKGVPVTALVFPHTDHGGLDKRLSEAYPAQEADLKKNNIRYEGHIYPNSVHGFFNDATPERYNKVTAQQAWTRTIEWFNQYVRA